ncbi:MAG: hypothetical protein ACKVIX_06565 [Sphingomonadales bacterium]|jgi:hypothetical protein
MNKLLVISIAASMLLGTTATAGVGIGAVLSINLNGEVSLGARAFTLNKSKKFVGSGGLNYNFMSNSIEPILGLGYTFKGGFGGADIAYSIKDTKFNIGAAAGWSNAKLRCPGGVLDCGWLP